MNERDPLEVIRNARAYLVGQDECCRFAYGLLLRLEHELSGISVYPAKFLPQSNPVDFNSKPSVRLTRYGYKYA